MLGEMTQRLDATSGHIEMDFPYFVHEVGAGLAACRA